MGLWSRIFGAAPPSPTAEPADAANEPPAPESTPTPSFNPSEAEAAAAERKSKLKTPIKDKGPATKADGVNELRGAPPPNTLAFDAGRTATFTTPLTPSDFTAMERCFATSNAVRQLGSGLASMDIVVFGKSAEAADTADDDLSLITDPAKRSDRAKYMQRIVDGWRAPEQMLQEAPWSMPFGILFWQLRWMFERGRGMVAVFEEGKRYPVHAGGLLLLGPDRDRIIKQRSVGGGYATDVDIESYDIADWVYLKPGGTPSLIGDMAMAHRFREYVGDYRDAVYRAAQRAKQYGLPFEILKYEFERATSTSMSAAMQDNADILAQRRAGEPIMMGSKHILELAEPGSAQGLYLNEREKVIEAKCSRDINLTAQLSDLRSQGPNENGKEARMSANTAETAFASAVVVPQLDRVLDRNIYWQELMFPGSVPPLKDGESELWVQLIPRGLRAQGAAMGKKPAADRVPQDQRPLPKGQEELRNPAEKEEDKKGKE